MQLSERLSKPQSVSKAEDLEEALESVAQDVYRYARFRMMNIQDAEDATMETLHALRRNSRPFLEARSRTFFAIGVCRRKIANIVRANRFKWFAKRPESDLASMTESQVAIGQTLAQLSPEHREILALKYFHEFTQDEIAALIGRSPSAVNSLLQRARQAFAEISPSREVFE
jgi:RNA polymerase sigma-70 factor (ECF subfamily)